MRILPAKENDSARARPTGSRDGRGVGWGGTETERETFWQYAKTSATAVELIHNGGGGGFRQVTEE